MRYIVDAMNVIGSRPDGWWKDRPAALRALVQRVERWALAGDHDVTVVLERPMSPPLRSAVVTIEQAPVAAANSADDEIVRLVTADGAPAQITVVTSDATLTHRVRALGADVTGSGGFRDLLD